ncbi:hypothetical protein [Corynebacterium sp. HMSC29G08]|uniref:hypothetical protein n=1 Tax=Corynebacterium sp. HMSC29G08 TaxID=1581069 RepID=UPI0008CDFAC4|nr:hypothetical protein [Corynebacterium sp. HMSC29G08]OFT84713.1 hypothetical protein HMPREF3101_03915 [Corynebacterium sp. HMSC29G08]
MTTTMFAPFETATCETRSSRPEMDSPVLECVFEVEGMGRGQRWSVEKQMLLLPEGEPGEVWFTRWRRAPDGTYSCRERIVGTAEEIEVFAAGLEALAERGNFVARVTQRTYAWAYV